MKGNKRASALAAVFKQFFADEAYWGNGVVDDEVYEVDGTELPSGTRVPQDFADISMVTIVTGFVHKDGNDLDYREFFEAWLVSHTPRYLLVEVPSGREDELKSILEQNGFVYRVKS